MHPSLLAIKQSMVFTGQLERDIIDLLTLYNCPRTAEHSLRVGDEAARLAARFNGDTEHARTAGLLHDISAIIPNSDRIRFARELHIDILPEESAFPMIIHQKLSRIIARDLFQIRDPSILNAIGCHTTLQADPSPLDLIVFVADKIEWDQPGTPPYLDALLKRLDVSLESGAFVYIDYLWRQKERLKVIHPWLSDAYRQLKANLADAD
ncbi:bis(5'-nucleosyl)-tetraphosphatase (symmetrical) YqeK [Paenibacillus doosanensis]|uniref:bis(5'-nucleosyl)-tetraphosphatase (symmetrical) n=1 Tax=Paenibacillus konkukensis TaxID=2020716 RepID=A0ABY4RTT3_9BACL|nr:MULTISPECIES: bis(5'-nucleosyl)-tetraphosphatase (symmetrical) YqeK [Paenibacillus]MCS7462047.1 bis(5'-nucleosyl)-tetraphosphatase (symmetrical) YqeK [Paenibacillus doosanensis]UQZ85114.1 putative nicotinate-nucleotide adenylyltransferase [Paenibacillus konkukensis]